MSRTPDPSPDSNSARKALQKSGLGSYVGSRNIDFAGRSGGPLRESLHCRLEFLPRGSGEAGRGHHRGTKVHAGPAEPDPVYNRRIIENPLSLALLGEHHMQCAPHLFGLLCPRHVARAECEA
jgi:hypothetical protein